MTNRRPKTRDWRLNKKGQIGPQGLEDIPFILMAFIAGVLFMMLFFNLVESRALGSRTDDLHAVGKRLVEAFSGEVFKSNESRAYGDNVIDGNLLTDAQESDTSLKGLIGPVEYSFSVVVATSFLNWEFGKEPPETALSYEGYTTILWGEELHDAKIIVKIWK